ncbi:MAG: hypothetical protein WA208_09360, partial [Thermoanaerobaculia bacterium]
MNRNDVRSDERLTIDRRALVRNGFLAGAGLMLAPRLSWSRWQGDTAPPPFVVDPGDPWASLPALLARITPPRIPQRDFVITKFGA